MIFFTTLMLASYLALHTIVFPHVLAPNAKFVKLPLEICFLACFFFGGLTWLLGPGQIKNSENLSRLSLLTEFEATELCAECLVVTMPRSRHCNVCSACVDRYDHHCPWLNTCIGRKNHATFLVFIISQVMLLFLTMITTGAFYVDRWFLNDNYHIDSSDDKFGAVE